MHTLAHDLRYALRLMQRNPGIIAVAVLALGLGIGANTAMFTVLNGVLLRPLPFPESDRLLVLSRTPATGPFVPTPCCMDTLRTGLILVVSNPAFGPL